MESKGAVYVGVSTVEAASPRAVWPSVDDLAFGIRYADVEPWHTWALEGGVDKTPTDGEIAAVDQPTLALWASDDHSGPARAGQGMTAEIRGADRSKGVHHR